MVWERLQRSPEIASSAACNNSTAAASTEEYEVQKGDWLHDICRRHDVDLRSLMTTNPTLRDPNSLIVGSRVKIPVRIPGSQCSHSASQLSSTAAEVPVAVPVTRTKGITISTSSAKVGSSNGGVVMSPLSHAFGLLGHVLWKRHREYEVVEGDSLEWLAEKFRTSVNSIRRLNNLRDDIIYTGSILKIEQSVAYEQQKLPGRKASVQERAASELGYRLDSSVKTFVSVRPVLKVSARRQNSKAISSPKTVKVQYGDTLADIATAHGLSVRELQNLNHLRDDFIYEGDVLAVKSGPSKTDFVELRPGRRRTNRPLFSRQLHSGLGVGGPRPPGRTKPIMVNGIAEGRWKNKSRGFQPQERWMRFKSPLTTGFVSSSFGWRWGAFHEGVDLAADQGTPILASDKGTVTFAGWSGRYGYLISIQHEGGFITRYAHCCAIHARVGQSMAWWDGQQVSSGQPVAAVGSTGNSTGPHLHFEVRRNGEALDPFHWVNL